MKFFSFLFSLLLSFAEARAQSHSIEVSGKYKPEPFFQKISLVSDMGMANSFATSNFREENYKPEPKMNLGIEIESPVAYFEFSYNLAEKAPEFKLGSFILKEKLVIYLAFSKQLKPYEQKPEGMFVGGFEGNFNVLKIFNKDEDEDSRFGFLVSPFVEIGTSSPDELTVFNFGFVFKPKYHFFVRS